MFKPSYWIERATDWYILRVRKLEEKHEDQIRQERAYDLTQRANLEKQIKELQHELHELKQVEIDFDMQSFPLLVSRDALLTQKEQMDIATLVNLDQYASLRAYYLKTTMMLYDRASLEDATDSKTVCTFANLLRNFVIDMDRMKIEHKEEQSPEEPYEQ